jgi:Zn-finger nucleic acid-binding protein
MHTLSAPNTDVELDSCAEHGTWFDRGELQTLIREMDRMTTPAAASPFDSSASTQPTTSQPRGPHPITPEELRAQMIAEYGVDPSAPPQQGTPSLDFAQGVATNLAIDVGISILGSLLGGSRR